MRRNEFAVVAVATLLLLAGCTGGGPSNPETTTGAADGVTTTVESETSTDGGTTTTATTSAPATTATETETTTAQRTTTATSNESGLLSTFDSIAQNYSAGGDLDAKQVARRHLQALDGVESVTVRSTTRTGTSNWSSVQYLRTERNATHRFHRQNGSGMDLAVYKGPDLGAMAVESENGTEHVRIESEDDGEADGRRVPEPDETYVLALAKLQTMPYEKVGTVERNGTTLTKYEATGPGYYATRANVTVESFASTLLVGEDGLVRYFHHEVSFQRRGQTKRVETTLRYADVGTTDVTVPTWLDEVRQPGDETGESEDDA